MTNQQAHDRGKKDAMQQHPENREHQFGICTLAAYQDGWRAGIDETLRLEAVRQHPDGQAKVRARHAALAMA